MEIFIEEKEGIIVLYLTGRLSSESIKNFDEISLEQIKLKPDIIALDCTDFEHVDSFGIHHLFQFAKKAADSDIETLAFSVNSTVHQLLEMTGLNTFIKIVSKKTFESEYLHISRE